ncbi:isochorismatase family protein, partial [Desulfobacula sp.]
MLTAVIQKGMDAEYDSYSRFFDDGGMKTGLDECLRSYQVTTLIVYGLAMAYCVKASVMDALKLGFQVILVEDLCKGVAKETTLSAIREMTSAGVKIIADINGIT